MQGIAVHFGKMPFLDRDFPEPVSVKPTKPSLHLGCQSVAVGDHLALQAVILILRYISQASNGVGSLASERVFEFGPS